MTVSLAAISSIRRKSLPDLHYNIAGRPVTPNHLYTHIQKNDAHSVAMEEMSSHGEIAANSTGSKRLREKSRSEWPFTLYVYV